MNQIVEDPKFARVQPGAPWWYWNSALSEVIIVVRDGSGKLWANWGDGLGSATLPDGPAIDQPCMLCDESTRVRCVQRGEALATIRELAGPVLSKRMHAAQVSETDLATFSAMLKIHTTAHGVL